MRERTRVTVTRRDFSSPEPPTHGPRLRYLPTNYGHAARPRSFEATRGYQSDTPSVMTSASVLPGAHVPKTQRPPPERWSRVDQLDNRSCHISGIAP